jgi:hypothetical protein
MNRLGLTAAAVTLAALACGCSGGGNGPKMNNPFAKQPANAPSGKADYFEMKKDGRTYVFSRVESMNAFREGNPPPRTTTQQLGGRTVVFEDRGYTDANRLAAEYKKAHNVQ